MERGIRILHTADSHIGAGLPDRPRHDRPRRGHDFLDSHRRVIEAGRRHGVDLVIHAGDLFDRPDLSPWLMGLAAEPLLETARLGIPVIIVPGNHERSSIPTNLLLSHPNIHILDRPTTLSLSIRGRRIAVSGFPCLRRGQARRFAESLDATNWRKIGADRRLLAVHQTFATARCGPANYCFRTGDEVVPREAVPEAFDYVAAGHVHRYQCLEPVGQTSPPIVYAGSPDRIAFAEIDEPKGYVLVEIHGNYLTHTFIEHDVRPMSLWPIDVTGLNLKQITERLEGLLLDLPQRAVAEVRLTGHCTNGALRDLGFPGRARELRPDVTLTMSSRAVVFGGSLKLYRPATIRNSVFDRLDAPRGQVISMAAGQIARLPDGCGVYALRDSEGRLLYIGKARRLRTRVRCHLRGGTACGFFAGWNRQIAGIETRLADSELEALMLEAELIRRLQPPFNRQMRQWARYRYLVAGTLPCAQLEPSRSAAGRTCFGPFRNRRQAEQLCELLASHLGLASCPNQPNPPARPASLCGRFDRGACRGPSANRIDSRAYEDLVHQRNAFLRGADDTWLVELERELAAGTEDARDEEAREQARRDAKSLRFAFDYLSTVAQAERLMHAMIIMPAPGEQRTVAVASVRGMRFERIGPRTDDVRQLRSRWREWTGGAPTAPDSRLPLNVLDGLCVAARNIRRHPRSYTMIAPERAARATDADLLAAIFEEPPVRVDHPLTTQIVA